MVTINGYITDDNGTRIRGYREIRFAYRLLREALTDLHPLKFLYLGGPVHAKCWKLALGGDTEAAAQLFTQEALAGQSREHVKYFAENVFMEDSFFYGIIRRLPKAGRMLDTAPIHGANENLEAAHKKGKKTAILSMGFRELIVPHLKKHGVLDYLNFVLCNNFAYQDDKVSGIETIVADKGESIKHLSAKLGLPEDGSGVVYIGDGKADVPAFREVEYPVISPVAKAKFKEECRGEFGKKLFIPNNYQDVRMRFDLDI